MNELIFHGIPNFLGVLLCVFFVLFCARRFKYASFREKTVPIKFVYISMIICEILKIFYHVAVTGSLPPSRYPIIFCSFVMFAYPIICHSDPQKYPSRISMAISIIAGFAIGICYLFVIPSVDTIAPYPFIMNLHSRLYHFAMLAVSLYMLAVKLYDFRFLDFLPVGLTVALYFSFCTVFSIMLGGDISYFGPNSAPLAGFYKVFGFAVGNVLLSLFVVGLSVAVFYLINAGMRLFTRRKTAASTNPRVDCDS